MTCDSFAWYLHITSAQKLLQSQRQNGERQSPLNASPALRPHPKGFAGKAFWFYFLSVTPRRLAQNVRELGHAIRTALRDPPHGGRIAEACARHSLSDLKQACTSSHAHPRSLSHTRTRGYGWAAMLSHSAERAAVISAFSKARLRAPRPASRAGLPSAEHKCKSNQPHICLPIVIGAARARVRAPTLRLVFHTSK